MNDLSKISYDSCKILKALPSHLVDDYTLNGLFITKQYSKNEILHIEGDLCDRIELILDGEIAIERIGEAGDIMTINRFSTNSIIGSNLIFSSVNHYPMTITAKTDSTVIIIKKDLLFELCNQYPAFLMEFIKIISDLSVQIGHKIKNRVSRTIRDSIVIYLNKEYKVQNSYKINLTMSKKALSEMFGISRTSLSRELQSMKASGLIDFDPKSITILDHNLIRDY